MMNDDPRNDDACRRDAELIVRHIRHLGYHVSMHQLSASLLGTIPAAIELQAVDTSTEPPSVFVVNVKGERAIDFYIAACELAQMMGIDLAD